MVFGYCPSRKLLHLHTHIYYEMAPKACAEVFLSIYTGAGLKTTYLLHAPRCIYLECVCIHLKSTFCTQLLRIR